MRGHSYTDEQAEERQNSLLLNVVVLLGSFFLARAVFFEAAVPFFISLYAVIQLRYPQLKKWTIVGGLVGALTLGVGQAVLACLQLICFRYLNRLKSVPLAIQVTLSIACVQFLWQLAMHQGVPPMLVQFYVISEAVLALVMTLFLSFVIVPKHRFFLTEWTTERVVAAFLVIAVLFTGMTNFTLSFFNLAVISLHVVICIMAVVGGISLATVAGTVLGVVLGMSQLSFSGMIALYAITGVVAGSCKAFGKWGVAIGSVIPSIILFFYDATLPLDVVYFSSIGFAIVIVLCIPSRAFERLAGQVSPNQEYILLERQKWLTHHMTKTIEQFQQFVLFMKHVTSERFQDVQVIDKQVKPLPVCEGCYRYSKCWQGEEEIIEPLMHYYHAKRSMKTTVPAEELLRRKCVKLDVLLEQLRVQLYAEQMQQQLFHGRKMIGLQLQHLSEHIYHLLDAVNEQTPPFQQLEQQLLTFLQEVAIPCFQIDVIQNKAGDRRMKLACTGTNQQLTQLTESKIIPLLFEYFAEPFMLEGIEYKQRPFPYIELTLKSAQRFQLMHKVYVEKKGTVSGDTHAVFPVQEQLVAVVLSDGVGYDRLARQQSEKLVALLKDCLQFMEPEMAMHTIHYVLSLEQQDLYATLDFALVDLQQGRLWSWKAGGIATYILRGKQVLKIEGKSPPFGFMPNMQMETAMTNLQHGDLILMVSDGLFEGPGGFLVREKAFLKLLKQQNRQNLAVDVLLYDVIAQFKQTFLVEDDCTVLACRMQHIQAEWSVLKVM